MSKRTPAGNVRQPLDYAPRLCQVGEVRKSRCERWADGITFAVMCVLMWAVFLLSGIGVYISRVDGLEHGWLFLALAFGALVLIVGACCMSERVRRILRSEV